MITRPDIKAIKQSLENFRLKELLIEELGWNLLKEAPLTIPFKGQNYVFESLAEKGGFKIYTCTLADNIIPDDKILKQFTRLVEPYARENLLVFLDASHTYQAWLWVKRETGRPNAYRINRFYKGQSPELLAQKLSKIAFDIEEEDNIDVVVTYGRIKSGFDVDKVTTKFYERFKKEHTNFLGQIKGINDEVKDDKDREWYASLMLNRLMFIYFIQKKGFLDNHHSYDLKGDTNYLRNRLYMIQGLNGKSSFYTFYRYFLRRLFHEGLNKRERTVKYPTK